MKLLPKSPSTSFSKESPFVFLALAGIVMSMTFSAWNALLIASINLFYYKS
ncbi:Putative membrane protein [Moritella viscosa]|uniref:Putative membrane protein n=1 Tax=Moritella viscosa TaxID=80854 RepID=A0A1L0AHM5_9GAMM|nr:Putative membrane protein [Moritella viscosa]